MNTGELLADIRIRLRDTEGDASEQLWSDAEIIDTYANEAVRRLFTKVADLIIDSTTPDDGVGTLAITADIARYYLAAEVLDVKSVQLSAQSANLRKIGLGKLNMLFPNWRTMASGTPQYFCPVADRGGVVNSVVIVPPPLVDDTAYLTVSRLPLYELTSTDTDHELEWDYRYHSDIIPWILRLCYLKRDTQTFNPETADAYRVVFEGQDGNGGRCAEIAAEIAMTGRTQLSQATAMHGYNVRG